MTAIDLKDLSLKELKQLQKDVAKAVDGFETRKKTEALSILAAKAQEFGFSLADLMGVEKPRKSPGPAGAKYRHPENPEITWSGRGRQPAWFKVVVMRDRPQRPWRYELHPRHQAQANLGCTSQ